MSGNEAREVADLVKGGKAAELGLRLGGDCLNMKPAEFRDLLTQVQAENAKDRTQDSSLPDLHVVTTATDSENSSILPAQTASDLEFVTTTCDVHLSD